MKLLLRRDQKSGLIGNNITFTLDCRAEISEDEKACIKKYKMGRTILYTKSRLVDRGAGLIGLISRLIHKAKNVEITVHDLANGKHIECKDIVEMRDTEAEIREASQTFKVILEMAKQFGGEEIIEI